MSLQMIYGRSGRGKTEKLFSLLSESLERNSEIRKKRFVIVPDQFSYTMEKKIMNKFGMKNIFTVQTMGFSMLCQRILESAGGIKRKTLSSAGRSMLIKSILREEGENLGIYAGTALSEGFGDLAGSALKEFKTYGKKPLDILLAADSVSNEETAAKLKDLGLIYQKYEEKIKGKFPDGEDRMMLAAEKFTDASILKGAEFYLGEFSDFTKVQMKLIEKMMKHHDTYITLTMDENTSSDTRGVFSLTAKTDGMLMEAARENSVKIYRPIYVSERGRFKSEELNFLEKNFFGYTGKTFGGAVNDIRIIKASDISRELSAVAGDILRRVREDGIRFKDIAVLLRDPETYESDLKATMEEAGIPVFMDRRRDIGHNPLISAVSAFFDIYSTGFSSDAVMRYLKTGLSPLDTNTVCLLENYVLENGIKNAGWLKDYWEYPMRFRGDEREMTRDLNIINEAREIISETLEDVFIKLSKAKGVRDMAGIFYIFLKESGILGKYQDEMERFKEENPLVFNEYRQTADSLMEVLDQAVEILGDEKITPEEFGKNITAGLMSSKIALVPATLDQVIVGDVSRIKSSSVKGVYIMGANDGVLPRRPEQDPVLNDEDRKQMQEKGIIIGGTTSERVYYEDFYLYSALSSAGEFLTISYPVRANDGSTLRPSPMISRLKKNFRYLSEEAFEANGLNDLATESEALSALTRQLQRFSSGREVDPEWKELYGYFQEDGKLKMRLKAVSEGLKYESAPGKIKVSSMEKLFGRNIPVTVSRAEAYNRCPFAYFAKYGLKANERKEHVVERFDDGNIMHSVLDLISKKLVREGKTWEETDAEYLNSSVEELMDETMAAKENSVFRSSAQLRHRLEKLKRNLKRTVDTISSQISLGEFIPIGSEITFGKGGTLPGITIPISDTHSVNVSGIIDRADILKGTDGTFVRVIDYKSSKRSLDISDVLEGLQLQLIVYLNILIKNRNLILKGSSENEKLLPAAVFYSFLERPRISSETPMTAEEIRKKILSESKFEGVILENADIVVSMDSSGENLVTKFSVNAGGEISRRNPKLLSERDFEDLMEYSLKLIESMAQKLLMGEIPAFPVKKGQTPQCTYCPYKAICRFDPTLPGSEYRIVKKRGPEAAMEEVRRRLEGGGEEKGE